MRHKDVIYVSNADAVEVGKFLAYLLLYTSTTSGIVDDVRLTRESIRVLR